MKKGCWKRLPIVKQLRGITLNEKVAQRKFKQAISKTIPVNKVTRFKKLKDIDRRTEKLEVEKMVVESTFQILGLNHNPKTITKLATLIVSGEIRNEMQREKKEIDHDSQYENSKRELLKIFNNHSTSLLAFFDMRNLVMDEYLKKAKQIKS